MTQDAVLFGYRLQVFDLAGRWRVGHLSHFGAHRSTRYAWKRQVDRHGLEMLRPRMPNQLSAIVEERIVALARPSLGPRWIGCKLARPLWGGIVVSANGVWRCLRRHGSASKGRSSGNCYPEKRGTPAAWSSTASTQLADLTRDDPGCDRPIERTDMEAELAAQTGTDGPKETAELPLVSTQSEVADPPARRPRLNTFTRLARFSTHTKRWHSVDRASGERGDVTHDDMPKGNA